MSYKVPELASKRPLYYDVVEGKPFGFTIERHRVGVPNSNRFKQLFKSFGDRRWVKKDKRSRFKDCYKEFADDLRYMNLDDSGKRPEVEAMITILSHCPELKRRIHTKRWFAMCCLCPGHRNLNVTFVGLGSGSQNVAAPDLPTFISPLQHYLLWLKQACSFFDTEA